MMELGVKLIGEEAEGRQRVWWQEKKETFYPADSYTADKAKNHYMSWILLWICESSKEWLLKSSRGICDLLLIRRLMHPPLLMLPITEAIAQAFFYCINFLCYVKLGSITHVAAKPVSWVVYEGSRSVGVSIDTDRSSWGCCYIPCVMHIYKEL